MENPSGSGNKGPALCQICDNNPSKYMCPRCGIPYCSLACYKNESKHLECSESFYRDCVVESIKNEEAGNPEGAKKMKEALQRFHEQYNKDDGGLGQSEDGNDNEELDSDDDEPLDKRLAGIDLNDSEEVWKHLSDAEKREFQSLLNSRDGVGDIIPEWVPWWNEEPEKKLIVDVSDVVLTQDVKCITPKLHERQPNILSPIPKMGDLTRIKPSEHVTKGLVNVIGAYVWTAKLFNGDVFDCAKITEVASSLINLSSFLCKDAVFKNMEHAIADVPMNACKFPDLSEGGSAIQASLSGDIWRIVKGPLDSSTFFPKAYLLSALTECYMIFVKVGKSMKIKNTMGEKTETSHCSTDSFSKLFPAPPPVLCADVKLINKAKRKLLYLLAFANEFVDGMGICTA